ncbi:MAG TPA: LacI family DNA-binding transcriptional regulator [Microlunatus sp.]
MTDVAKLAGVSTMTVSNVLNNRPHVRDALRQRVLDAVDASGYVVNNAARSLRRGSTGVIGLAIPELDRPYFGQLAARVIARSADLGYRVAIEQTGAALEGELAAIALSRTLDCDGLILSAVGLGPDEIRRLGQTIPLVLLGENTFGDAVDHVAMANEEGTLAATTHLIERGCRRIVWVSQAGTANETSNAVWLRGEGYRKALRRAQLELDPALQLHLDALTMAEGARAVRTLLDDGRSFDGVVAVTDTVAFGVLRGLADRGLTVPDDVRVIGFDDVLEAQFNVPSLSTVAPDHDWMVDTALDMLMARIEGRPRKTAELTAPFHLTPRESTR